MNNLLRDLAPITESGWETLDSEARERLAPALAARKLVDFAGPHGWQHAATKLGRTRALDAAPAEGVQARQRRVLALVELRAPFEVSLEELRDLDRGAVDTDLASLDAAAHSIAVAENTAVFHGWSEAAIAGVAQASPHDPCPLGASAEEYPRAVAGAVETLRGSGIGGPYGLALGPDQHRRVIETAEHGGTLVLDHLHKLLDGPLVWAPGVQGAIVLSMRGGDFLFDCGQDLSIGYERHDAERVQLYLEESFSFVVASPDAAVALTA